MEETKGLEGNVLYDNIKDIIAIGDDWNTSIDKWKVHSGLTVTDDERTEFLAYVKGKKFDTEGNVTQG